MLQEPVVILANGDFPTHKVSLLILQDAGTIICCDGSVNNLVKNGMEPHYILGDMDSIDDNLKIKYKEQLIELPDQNENDLLKTIQWVENKGVKDAIILGATGKRDDHSLANIFILLQHSSPLKITLYTNYGIFSVIQDKQKFDSFIGQQISLFATDPKIEVTSNNLKYNFNRNTISTLFYGTLNECINDFFEIEISHGTLLIFQTY